MGGIASTIKKKKKKRISHRREDRLLWGFPQVARAVTRHFCSFFFFLLLFFSKFLLLVRIFQFVFIFFFFLFFFFFFFLFVRLNKASSTSLEHHICIVYRENIEPVKGE